ncbi:MAG TPA: hypothetical protein VLA19_21860, partial [Herpetosiphonaceae bacterium]|nr:hypothetical protein [Herpetosiphonaceae bacterium]
PEDFKGRVLISPDLQEHRDHIQHFIDLGFTEVYIHNVGRNQTEFLEACGREIAPALHWPEPVPAVA